MEQDVKISDNVGRHDDNKSNHDSDSEDADTEDSDSKDHDPLGMKTKKTMRPRIIKSFERKFYLFKELQLNNAEIKVLQDTCHMDFESLEKLMLNYLWQTILNNSWEKSKTDEEKKEITDNLRDFEEKLECLFINPTHFGIFEVFKGSKEIFDMIFEHSYHETQLHIHKNYDKYEKLMEEDFDTFYKETFEEMLFAKMDSVFKLTFENCVHRKLQETLDPMKGKDLQTLQELFKKPTSS